jgi:hypothetical protein
MRPPRNLHSLILSTPRISTSILFCRRKSTVPDVALTEQHGRKLTPWLRAMKEIRQRGANAPDLPRAELTPKRMSDSYYTVKLPFSTDEALHFLSHC